MKNWGKLCLSQWCNFCVRAFCQSLADDYLLFSIHCRYKESFSRLRTLKTEIEHLQHLLEKSKVKLMKDFEIWFAEQATLNQVHIKQNIHSNYFLIQSREKRILCPKNAPCLLNNKCITLSLFWDQLSRTDEVFRKISWWSGSLFKKWM